MVGRRQGLFFDNTLINLWHHEVLKMVLHTLEGHSEELLACLFEQGDLLRRIVASAQASRCSLATATPPTLHGS